MPFWAESTTLVVRWQCWWSRRRGMQDKHSPIQNIEHVMRNTNTPIDHPALSPVRFTSIFGNPPLRFVVFWHRIKRKRWLPLQQRVERSWTSWMPTILEHGTETSVALSCAKLPFSWFPLKRCSEAWYWTLLLRMRRKNPFRSSATDIPITKYNLVVGRLMRRYCLYLSISTALDLHACHLL